MRKLRYLLAALVLLVVFLSSALLAMRFAIHGREVRVPSLTGLTAAEAERVANGDGLVLYVESRFYAPAVPRGRIVSQVPAPETHVRRGWKILVAESLGPQRADIPNLIGQSEHAADINIGRHGLEIGSVSRLRIPGAPPDTVVAQSPLPDGKDATTPKVSLILSASDNAQTYVMPSFVGKPLEEAAEALEHAGFKVGKVRNGAASSVAAPYPPAPSKDKTPALAPGTVIRQYPRAGEKVAAGTAINFEIQR